MVTCGSPCIGDIIRYLYWPKVALYFSFTILPAPAENCSLNFRSRFMLNNRKKYHKAAISLSLTLLCITLGWGHGVVQAKPLDEAVKLYPIQCDELFSCPNSLLPRVGFWVEVFSRWNTNTAIFHDKENPQRVFSTLSRKEGCRRSRKGDSIDGERKRLKKSLKVLASKVERGKSLSRSQKQMMRNFEGLPASEIRATAERIRCQSGNQDRMREALTNFHRYRPAILDALEAQNLTPELQYLPFVESAFNPKALSHVGAAGMWQIMPSTGKSLGLKINHAVDERYDPRLATVAAAKYFRNSVDDLSETAFENGFSVDQSNLNPFVITSYNYGVRGMMRAIKQVGLDYEKLLTEYKSPNFQTAVKNFYASFLAARHVAKNSEQFFGVVEPNREGVIHSFNSVSLSRATSVKRIVKHLGVEKDDLKTLNPALRKAVWRDRALIPKSYLLKLPHRDQGWQTDIKSLASLPAEYEKPGYVWHRVRKGQTACGIAESYRASCSALRKLNRLNKRGTIYAGKRLKVPTSNGGIVEASNNNSKRSTGSNTSSSLQSYTVKSGDAACSIANRHGMRCSEFLAINGLRRSSTIRTGQRLKVSSQNSWHTVRRGQTACGIANSYRVSCSALLDANRLNRRSTIKIGQRLRIPMRG